MCYKLAASIFVCYILLQTGLYLREWSYPRIMKNISSDIILANQKYKEIRLDINNTKLPEIKSQKEFKSMFDEEKNHR